MEQSDDPYNGKLAELIHAIAHDLRNPLAAVVTNVEFSRRILRGGDADTIEAMDDTVTACEVLRRIICNLDIVTQAKDVATTSHNVMVTQVVSEVTQQCRSRARQTGVTINTIGTESDARAMLDQRLFALACENVICNAIQYSPNDSSIDVELRADGAIVTVAVRDIGPAIPENLRTLALSADGHTTRGRQADSRYGRGLGLLAARLAAEAAGATLTVGAHGTHSVMTFAMPQR